MVNFIAKNIKHLREQKELSQEAFGEILHISRAQVSTFERDCSSPSIDILIALSNYFKIPIDILIKNDLTKANTTGYITLRNKRILFPITVNADNEDLIEIVPVKASAGYAHGYDDPEYVEQLQNIKLPFLPTGKHRAFPIKGDSMLPMKDGAFVVGRFVEDRSDIISGKTYIVITLNDGMVYKRVYNHIEEDNTLTLASDNKDYLPYTVSIDEVLEIWEFACSINLQEYDESELKISSILNMFNTLGIELKALKKEIL
jgi:transcriptional regulator with XRE-family HTH domain